VKKFIRIGVDLGKNYFQVHALVSDVGPALFDVPRDIRPGGLASDERVEALSADHARTESGRTIERRKCNIFL
jgi:hypothetical protein